MGTPQGSTLGSLLFILYVNNMCNVQYFHMVNFKLYADDTVVYASGESVTEVHSTLQACMMNIQE